MSAPTWGRVKRGVTWHVLTRDSRAARDTTTWCGLADLITEETDAQPPWGARACLRCVSSVAGFARHVSAAANPSQASDTQPEVDEADASNVVTLANRRGAVS